MDFRNPTLESGTALQVGAVYRFSNVTTGADALVTIDAFNGASLAIIDRDTGLVDNFQPELVASGNSSVDFTITFVNAGTTTPLVFDFAASGIDIDGNNVDIREYAEFSIPLQEYVLNNPTRLDVNASGPSAANRLRFEARTVDVAPGIDPNEPRNIVTAFYADESTFEYRIGSLDTGNQTRLTSLDFSCPNLTTPNPQPQVQQDFGDAPLASYGDPHHDVTAGFQIGASNTVDPGPLDSPTASADGGDDGVTLPTFDRGVTAFIDVAVSGAGGRLSAWIDWAGNGNFTDIDDQIAADITDGGAGDTDGVANGAIRIATVPPGGAAPGSTFARFRWSSAPALPPEFLSAPDGEVEDYQVTITPAPPAPSCQAGFTVASQTGNAVAVTLDQSVANQDRALGAPAAPGTSPPDPVSAEMNANGDLFTIELGDPIPESSTLLVSLARDGGGAGNTARVEVLFSQDNTTFTSAGTYGAAPADFTSGAQDVIQHNNFVVPIANARFVQFNTLNGDDIFIDAVEYTQICRPGVTLNAIKTVSVIATDGGAVSTCAAAPDPGSPSQYASPGACIEYQISVNHPGGPNADSIDLVDTLPDNVTFASATQTAFTGGTIRTTDTGTPANTITCTPTTSSCTVRLEGATLNPGATGVLRIRGLVE
ncbi:MAG: GEVED domain-containing protein [Pseudomonadota bacterium]